LEAAGKPKHSQEDGRDIYWAENRPIRHSDDKTEKGQFNGHFAFSQQAHWPNQAGGNGTYPRKRAPPEQLWKFALRWQKCAGIKTNALCILGDNRSQKRRLLVEVEKEVII
jgi:hypothetical protein